MYWAIFVAFGCAFGVSTLELASSKYHGSRFLLLSIPALWWRGLIYGLISATAFYFLAASATPQKPLVMASVSLPLWAEAAIFGISTKALLHIRLFQLNVGPTPTPIGVETITLLFEPMLLRNIEQEHYAKEMHFLQPYHTAYPVLKDVKERAKKGLPSFLAKHEQAAFKLDFDAATDPKHVMRAFLRTCGKSIFVATFPL